MVDERAETWCSPLREKPLLRSEVARRLREEIMEPEDKRAAISEARKTWGIGNPANEIDDDDPAGWE